MANLSPLFTGLPFVVWISVRGNARHDIRVKVSKGKKAQPGQMISVALRPEVRVVGQGALSSQELNQLKQWVDRNWDVLLAYWKGEIFTEQAIISLKRA
jgi:ubiquinone biosynthesis protein UbiJ